MNAGLQSFLLALSALFSIINPIGGSIIFSQVTADRTHAERTILARKIAGYATLVILCALWFGASVLSFFGISLAALRIAGGFIVAFFAWHLLNAPERTEERKQEQAAQSEGVDTVAFYPLTMPFTTGPGTISVAIALGSNLPPLARQDFVPLALGASLAAFAIAGMIWVSYAWADRIVEALGRSGARVVSRLSAFLLLCIGVQIGLNGIADFVRAM